MILFSLFALRPPGWSIGALSMRIGERALIHVPAIVGYGAKEQGTRGRGWYIPANSDLVFDLFITSTK